MVLSTLIIMTAVDFNRPGGSCIMYKPEVSSNEINLEQNGGGA